MEKSDSLCHYGKKGMKWGKRKKRQTGKVYNDGLAVYNPDGTVLTRGMDGRTQRYNGMREYSRAVDANPKYAHKNTGKDKSKRIRSSRNRVAKRVKRGTDFLSRYFS